jgi:hypothetical protein
VIPFGVLVEFRTAFLSRHMGDLGCYLKAAWAVRTGHDPYAVTDNGWHYNYPPLLAILMTPLAEPPEGEDASGMVPFAVSAAVWYVFSVLCLLLAVLWLAGALERASADPAVRGQPRGCWRWWALRIMPVVICLPPIAHTLMRGQSNLLLLALLCGMAAATLRGRRWLSGLCLAGAICLKVYPAFLLLYPAWRRDTRCLAGCAVGLLAGLVVIPAAVFGPDRAVTYYREWAEVLVGPALGVGEDQSRAKELIEVTATDSQSLLATLHNTLHLDRATRPGQASAAVRLASLLAGGLLTLAPLLVARRRRGEGGAGAVIFLGALVLNMLLLCPVCHLHYFCLALPLVMGMLALSWEGAPTPGLGVGWVSLLAVNVVANALPLFPGLELLRDAGLAMYAALLLWTAGLVLWARSPAAGSGTRNAAGPGYREAA